MRVLGSSSPRDIPSARTAERSSDSSLAELSRAGLALSYRALPNSEIVTKGSAGPSQNSARNDDSVFIIALMGAFESPVQKFDAP